MKKKPTKKPKRYRQPVVKWIDTSKTTYFSIPSEPAIHDGDIVRINLVGSRSVLIGQIRQVPFDC